MSNELYNVEKILNRSGVGTTNPMYLVKWQGYSEQESTWEPVEHLTNVYHLLQEFDRKADEKAKQKLSLEPKSQPPSMEPKSQQPSLETKSQQHSFETKSQQHSLETKSQPVTEIVDNSRKGQVVKFAENIEGLVLEKILTIKDIKEKGGLHALVSWEPDSDGIINDPSIVKCTILRSAFPDKLIDYYESKIKFIDNTTLQLLNKKD
jgi:hypothetical protein